MPSILSLSPHPTQPKMLVLAPGDGGLCMYRTNRKYNQDSTFERCGGLSTDSVRVSTFDRPTQLVFISTLSTALTIIIIIKLLENLVIR